MLTLPHLKKYKILKATYLWGLVGGGSAFLWLVAEYVLGFHTWRYQQQAVVTNFELLIPLWCAWAGLNQVKKRDYKGVVTFGKLVKEGFILAAISAIIAALGVIIYLGIINPGYTAFMVNVAVEKANATHQNTTKAAEFASMYYGKQSFIIQTFLSTIGFGTFFGLLVAFLIKSPVKQSR